jgi:RHS repeat-associated protein
VAAFTFDADEKRVKSVIDQETILFVGAHFEIKNGNQITKYYMAGSTRIAMRKYTAPQPMTVEYMLSDHLGSTSLTADADGNKVLEIRYREASRAALWRVDKACPLRYPAGVLREGEIRATWTSSPSTTPAYKMPLYQYTGQASYMDDPLTSGVTEGFGLMFYQSRFYDPQLSRFTQADTIIPQEQGTQAWDRYAYVNNNPVQYIDPTGHSGGRPGGAYNGPRATFIGSWTLVLSGDQMHQFADALDASAGTIESNVSANTMIGGSAVGVGRVLGGAAATLCVSSLICGVAIGLGAVAGGIAVWAESEDAQADADALTGLANHVDRTTNPYMNKNASSSIIVVVVASGGGQMTIAVCDQNGVNCDTQTIDRGSSLYVWLEENHGDPDEPASEDKEDREKE